MSEIRYTSPRMAIGPSLVDLAKTNDKIVVVDADLASSVTTNLFQNAFPDRFIEMGIAEQSCMSASSGLAAEGFIPFFASMALFTVGTAWTQLRQACYANRNIKLVGSHPGVDDGPDGASHHALEDLAMTRTIPNLVVMTPADENEVPAAFAAAIAHHGPVYIRVGRDNAPVLHQAGCGFDIGKAEMLRDEGNDFAILFEGAASAQALEGYDLISAAGAKGKLVSVRTLNPLDSGLVRSLGQNTSAMITVENHNIHGGLGGAVAEVLASLRCHAPLRYVGIRHVFTESGQVGSIKKKYRLTGEEVLAQYLDAVKGKD